MAAAISFFFLRPFSISISRYHNKIPIIHRPLFTSLPRFSSLTAPRTPSLTVTKSYDNNHSSNFLSLLEKEIGQKGEEIGDEVQEYDSHGDDDEEDLGIESTEVGSSENSGLKVVTGNLELKRAKLPNLTVKEKKELASYAHGLGKKLKYQLVGKSGVTDHVVSSFDETLEANELLKVKILRTCPGELEDVVQQLEKSTGSVVVGQIGRTIIIYRPSLTKLKAEEKKKQAQRVFLRRNSFQKPAFPRKGQVTRFSGRGRRGSSRQQSLNVG